jgi:hypothetical protein
MMRFTLFVVAFAACASCTERHYYIYADAPGAGGGADVAGGNGGASASSSAEASATTTAGGVGGEGGAIDHGPTSSAMSASASASSSASATSATSASSGAPEPVDCTIAPIHTPCESGLCARDGVCRPWIRCKTRRAGWERTVDCSDPNVDFMSMHENSGPQFNYSGCRHHEPNPTDTYKPMACVTGDRCSVQLKDWSGWPLDGNSGTCE